MHIIIKIFFLFNSVSLIFLIILQPSEGKDISSFSGINQEHLLTDYIRGKKIIFFTAFLAFCFFLFCLILCNINYYNIHDLKI